MTDKTYGQIQREYRVHLNERRPDDSSTIKVSLQSNFTIEPFASYLWSAADAENISLSIHTGPYNQYTQEFLNPESEMYSSKPHIVFLLFGPGLESLAESIPESLCAITESFRKNSDATLVVCNLIQPAFPFHLSPSSALSDVHEANQKILKLVNENSGTHLLDINDLSAFYGREKTTELKLHYLGKIDFSHGFMELLARKCLTYIRLKLFAPRKVLVLDLDNTLWGGIVGEDGFDGISLSDSGSGAEYYDFQKEIKALQQRGVLLAICSKNNPEDALNVINNHPCMILRENDFSALQINWENKADNILKISTELNLGIDSFVFLDDSPVERGMVKAALPEVAVPELPRDSIYYATFLRHLDLFESFSHSAEDANRTIMYSEEKNRDSLKTNCVTVDDYIKSLNITISISHVNDKTFSRACQLLIKTNQFNMTTRRHSDVVVKTFMDSEDNEIFTLGVKDNFGDSGITGLAILKYEKDKCIVETFLLSCRILGRRIEETFLAVIVEKAKKRARYVIGEYLPSKKNTQVAGFYEKAGFTARNASENLVEYELDTLNKSIVPCELHRLEVENLQ